MNNNTHEEKTEHPTEHHIKKFQKKGQTKYSRELNALLILFFSFINLWWYKEKFFFQFNRILLNGLSFNSKIITDQQDILLGILLSVKEIIISFFPFLLCLLLIILFPPIFFSGIKFNFRSLKFNLNKINPFLGIKRIFSVQIIMEMFKNILKLLFIVSIICIYSWICFSKVLMLIVENPKYALLDGLNITSKCCLLVILGLIPIVILDVAWKEFNYYKKLKMTRQERKEEYKETEGNPNIKMRIRQQMRIIARRRMMLDVPHSDVVITNPIHYAIALKYDETCMKAPKVIAKGEGLIALNIKKIAISHHIAIISSPSLARSLYRYGEIGQYIPGPLYKAVAEVLAWVWKIRKWKKDGGSIPKKPNNIQVPSELNFTGKRKNNV
ncbi:flagellar biosynthesis protein FlhB [Buchnera aphidicola]|uniref:flagellar biosynthesis protein FlhB n=1 Tax=Buchnera aphidicola TaxID=9 RepID=UPI003BEED5F4